MNKARTVDEYINKAPAEVRGKLNELRSLIKRIAPKSVERISYGMPFYDYKGPLVYFAAMKDYIGLYIPPPIIANHQKELQKYKTTKSAIHLPSDKLPTGLIKKLVKARVEHNDSKIKKSP